MTWLDRHIKKLITISIALSLFCFLMGGISQVYGVFIIRLPEFAAKWFAPSSEADLSVTFTPAYGVGAPTDLRLTYVNDYLTLIEWVRYPTANNTIIRASFNSYPISITDGYEVYYGPAESANDTAINWYDNPGTIYVSGFSDNYTGSDNITWASSAEYATALLENPIVADLSTQLEILGLIINFIAFVPLIFFSVLAFWKENHILFLITSGVAMLTGLYTPDMISGNYSTTSLGIAIGLGFVSYSFLCVGWALKLIFWRSD